ncbi:MAG: sigma-70 family RNA polymerase sigma factor [Pseudomonadota bacterium]|nr:sigma-70 family RNA polymerase sigma factor [Pseudomonadota bacterium]
MILVACKNNSGLAGKYPKVTDCDFPGAESDGALMARVAARDRQAFEVLYRRYAPMLGRYLLRLLKNRELIEEALNDVMLTLWLNAGRFDSSCRLSSWLFGIAHKKGLKALQRASRHSAGPDGELKPSCEENVSNDVSDHETPEQDLDRHDQRRTLAKAIAALSAEHRAVIELTFFHGLPYQEIAEIVGAPVNTIKTRMFHARRRLAEILTERR